MNRKSVERGVNRQPGEIPLGAAVEQDVYKRQGHHRGQLLHRLAFDRGRGGACLPRGGARLEHRHHPVSYTHLPLVAYGEKVPRKTAQIKPVHAPGHARRAAQTAAEIGRAHV